VLVHAEEDVVDVQRARFAIKQVAFEQLASQSCASEADFLGPVLFLRTRQVLKVITSQHTAVGLGDDALVLFVSLVISRAVVSFRNVLQLLVELRDHRQSVFHRYVEAAFS